MKNKENIYQSAAPRKLDKFNSDAQNFCESAGNITDEQRAIAAKQLAALIKKTKDNL